MYTSPSAVRLVLTADGDSTDPSTAAGLDDPTLAASCQQASDEVDARLGVLYTVPFADPPAVVGDITTDIAAYLVTLTFRGGQPVEPTDPVYMRYQRAVAFLKDLASGAAVLPGQSGGSPDGEIVTANPIGHELFGPDDFGLYVSLTGAGRLRADRYGYDTWYG